MTKPKIIHLKRFDNGNRTPQEMHAQYAFSPGDKCGGCGAPPITRLTSFAEEAELLKRDSMLLVLRGADPMKYAAMRTVTKMGPYLRVACVMACSRCTPEAERAAAKHPSWMFVDVDKGPPPMKVVVGYGS
jgi:hypothetical protein